MRSDDVDGCAAQTLMKRWHQTRTQIRRNNNDDNGMESSKCTEINTNHAGKRIESESIAHTSKKERERENERATERVSAHMGV